jgi:hypothetical protein
MTEYSTRRWESCRLEVEQPGITPLKAKHTVGSGRLTRDGMGERDLTCSVEIIRIVVLTLKLGILGGPSDFASLLLLLVPFCSLFVISTSPSFPLLPVILMLSSLPLYLSRLVAVRLLRVLHGLLGGFSHHLFSLAFCPSIQHVTSVAI